MTFEFFTTKFHRARWQQKEPFTFGYCVNNFYPWKDIVGKKVWKLRSIAELHCKSEDLRKYFYQVYGTLQIALVHFFGNLNKKS